MTTLENVYDEIVQRVKDAGNVKRNELAYIYWSEDVDRLCIFNTLKNRWDILERDATFQYLFETYCVGNDKLPHENTKRVFNDQGSAKFECDMSLENKQLYLIFDNTIYQIGDTLERVPCMKEKKKNYNEVLKAHSNKETVDILDLMDVAIPLESDTEPEPESSPDHVANFLGSDLYVRNGYITPRLVTFHDNGTPKYIFYQKNTINKKNVLKLANDSNFKNHFLRNNDIMNLTNLMYVKVNAEGQVFECGIGIDKNIESFYFKNYWVYKNGCSSASLQERNGKDCKAVRYYFDDGSLGKINVSQKYDDGVYSLDTIEFRDVPIDQDIWTLVQLYKTYEEREVLVQ